jgi:dTDP-4-dehydrorhamnose reductase
VKNSLRKLLFGSNGFLGSAFKGCLNIKRDIDIFDYTEVRKLIKFCECDTVINCVVDRDRTKSYDELLNTNVLFPILLATACSSLGVRLVHFSTIYSGSYDGYTKTKEDSEKAVLKHPQHYVVRLPVLFNGTHEDCFLRRIVDSCLLGTPLTVYRNEFICPLFTNDVVEFVLNNKSTGIETVSGQVYLRREEVIDFVANTLHRTPNIEFVAQRYQLPRWGDAKIIFGSLDKKIAKCLESVNLPLN